MLNKLIRNDAEIFTTKEILDEFAEVLERDFLYNQEEIQNILEKVLQFLTLVTPSQKIDVVKEDMDDNKILECAVESGAEHVISYDNHLLKLGEYQGIKIIRPEDFLGF